MAITPVIILPYHGDNVVQSYEVQAHEALHGRRGIRELAVVESGVFAVWQGEQFIVRAALDDLARFDHADQVGIADRTQAVRDHHARAPPEQGGEGTLNDRFRARVNV